MTYTPDSPPQPWDFGDVELRWPKEPFDESFYPKGGFLEDCINYSKGYETTNAFAFWSGVHTVSSIVMRDAWLRWGHGGLYPNFYILFVAPPGVVKKSTTANLLDKVEMLGREKVETANARVGFQKQACIIRGKATQEAMFENMRSEVQNVSVEKDGKSVRDKIERNSNLVMRISELSNLLSSSKYNVNLIDKLTDFYDCKDRDSDTTIGRGSVELKNVYATLWGATTPDTLRSTIPREAFGGGFISRCLIIREQVTPRSYPHPASFPYCPQKDEMAERLAWIAMYKRGQFVLSPEAYTFYAQWYHRYKAKLTKDILSGSYQHTDNRKDIHILKLALILALQRYELNDNIISLDDIQQAIKIINWTLKSSAEEVKEASLTKASLEELKIEKFITSKERKGITRARLLQRFSRDGIRAKQLTEIIDNLAQRNALEIMTETGAVRKEPEHKTNEVYIFKE